MSNSKKRKVVTILGEKEARQEVPENEEIKDSSRSLASKLRDHYLNHIAHRDRQAANEIEERLKKVKDECIKDPNCKQKIVLLTENFMRASAQAVDSEERAILRVTPGHILFPYHGEADPKPDIEVVRRYLPKKLKEDIKQETKVGQQFEKPRR